MSFDEPNTLAARGAELHAYCREVRAGYPPGRGDGLSPSFRDVVVILASSRGGSSLLFDILRSTGAFLSLRGEHSTLYKLNGLGLPDDPDAHDGTIAPGGDPGGFLEALRAEVTTGLIGRQPSVRPDAKTQAGAVLRTLAQQWPGCPFGVAEAWEIVYRAICRVTDRGYPSAEYLLLQVIRQLRDCGWQIDPGYYDIAPALVREEFPELPRPVGPPSPDTKTLEAPPFLVPATAETLTEADLDRPLLLKASLDAYRIPLLHEIFPTSRLRFIHLTRNPAAAINGLVDGWLDRGFYSHNLSQAARLAIDGYSELGSWGSSWWNFDLPPGWRDLVNLPLPLVCAGQWLGAHSTILSNLPGAGVDVLQVRAEDVLQADRRAGTVSRILQYCGVTPLVAPTARVVMATKPPLPGRWRERGELLGPVLADPEIRACSARLGYGQDANRDWT